MASPQKENGYVEVALDLFAALMVAGFTDYERAILAETVCHHYGVTKRKYAPLHPLDLQTTIGVDHHNMRKAMKRLVDANVLIPVGKDGIQYRLNKDYESWRPASGALNVRLGGRLLGFVQGCLDRFKPKHISGSKKTPDDSRLGSKKTLESAPMGSKWTPGDAPMGSSQTPIDTTGRGVGGKEERGRARASEDLEIGDLEKGEGGEAPARPPVSASPPPTRKPGDWPTLADRIAGEVFGLTDSEGNADPDQAKLIGVWIEGASERAALAAAYKAKASGKRDPVRWFIGMCKNGLEEPSATNGKPRNGEVPYRPVAPLTPEQAAERERLARQVAEDNRRREAEDAALRARWDALADAERARITAKVKAENPQFARMPAMVRALALQAFAAQGVEA